MIGNEKNIFRKAVTEDKEAFLKAYDLYQDKIYRFIFFKIGSVEEAEDLTSAVFLKAWNTIREGNLKDVKTLRALFYTIARNLIIDEYRKKSLRDNISLEQIDELGTEKAEPEEKIDVQFNIENVQEKILLLKDEYREIVILKYIEDYSISEIADILGKTKGAVRVEIHRALKALQDLCGLNLDNNN